MWIRTTICGGCVSDGDDCPLKKAGAGHEEDRCGSFLRRATVAEAEKVEPPKQEAEVKK